MMQDFGFLLSPTSVSEFFAAYYEKAPLFVPREAPAYYDEIISIESVGEYLGNGGRPKPWNSDRTLRRRD